MLITFYVWTLNLLLRVSVDTSRYRCFHKLICTYCTCNSDVVLPDCTQTRVLKLCVCDALWPVWHTYIHITMGIIYVYVCQQMQLWLLHFFIIKKQERLSNNGCAILGADPEGLLVRTNPLKIGYAFLFNSKHFCSVYITLNHLVYCMNLFSPYLFNCDIILRPFLLVDGRISSICQYARSNRTDWKARIRHFNFSEPRCFVNALFV